MSTAPSKTALNRQDAWRLAALTIRRATINLTSREEESWRSLLIQSGEDPASYAQSTAPPRHERSPELAVDLAPPAPISPPPIPQVAVAKPKPKSPKKPTVSVAQSREVIDLEIERQDRLAFADIAEQLRRDRVGAELAAHRAAQEIRRIEAAEARLRIQQQQEQERLTRLQEKQRIAEQLEQDRQADREALYRDRDRIRLEEAQEKFARRASRDARRRQRLEERQRKDQERQEYLEAQQAIYERRRLERKAERERLEQEREQEEREAAKTAARRARRRELNRQSYRYYTVHDLELILTDDWREPHFRAERHLEAIELFNGDGCRHRQSIDLDIDSDLHFYKRASRSVPYKPGRFDPFKEPTQPSRSTSSSSRQLNVIDDVDAAYHHMRKSMPPEEFWRYRIQQIADRIARGETPFPKARRAA